MPIKTLPYRDTGYFSSLMCDYLDQKESLQPFYDRFPDISNFDEQIKAKGEWFSSEKRVLLIDRLKAQYEGLSLSEATENNMDALLKDNAFSITTGHQLNLFTGPLYFLYKIFSVINLCEELKTRYPKQEFVPVYWMATEDHDFDEINYFNLFGKKIQWNPPSAKTSGGQASNSFGAVGELSNEGLDTIAEALKQELGESENARALVSLFAKAYTQYDTLTEATRYLANELFSQYGLVIVDGNDAQLKKAFLPYAEKELKEQLSFKKVTESTKQLTQLGYKAQVTPREINLFYLSDGLRERIVEKEGQFYINNTELWFSLDDMLANSEQISPNALLRPLYQEVILPNLCYIGGGGELAYWFQLKAYFESVNVPFPMLLLRNSVLLLPKKFSEKLKKMDVAVEALFQKQEDLKNEHVRKLSEIDIDFSSQREHLKQQFADLHETAKKTDASFLGAVGAQEKKQLNGLDRLEKRLLKAQKRKLADQLQRLTDIQDSLFPGQSLQERNMNFSEFYLQYGDTLLSELKKNLKPLSHKFTILEL